MEAKQSQGVSQNGPSMPRTRKVKCDEAKPHCQRCTKSGRKCDGYRPAVRSPLPGAGALVPSSHTGLFASEAERRSFYYFQSHACHSLGGYFNASFWGREVIQAAIHYRPIRHLVVALGVAYERVEAGGDGIEGMGLALQQCNQSIQQLAHPSGTQSAEVLYSVLTASILFIYFACIRGRIPEAVQHVMSATKVLQNLDKQESNHARKGTSGPKYPVPLPQLRALLISVYGQLRSMINDIAPEEGTQDLLVTEVRRATIFVSLSEAHAYVERLFHNVLAFLQDVDWHPPSTAERVCEVVARHRELCGALESSREALEALAASLDPSDERSQRGVAVLRLHQILLMVRLRIDFLRPEQRESAFDELEGYLGEMLVHCEFLSEHDQKERRAVQKQQQQQGRPLHPCASGLGYVNPLYTIAARCRNPALRKRAVQLLLRCTRREGIWDGPLAGIVASQAQALEEKGGRGKVEADKRVREVKIEFQNDNSAVFQFVTVGDWKRGQPGAQKVVEWETAL
ncbi:Transcriptional regulatory protein moc3 [Madurella mycetomatis]|uniref:Transcriptional regulatory protein moc3 n=1 Tax=Madurella mycetomatis TaxID=100816 RepID=A0A175W2W4_9PEZI|nr:Transcriptional regulatory protein moc3 [Madurella mycetomatis]